MKYVLTKDLRFIDGKPMTKIIFLALSRNSSFRMAASKLEQITYYSILLKYTSGSDSGSVIN